MLDHVEGEVSALQNAHSAKPSSNVTFSVGISAISNPAAATPINRNRIAFNQIIRELFRSFMQA